MIKESFDGVAIKRLYNYKCSTMTGREARNIQILQKSKIFPKFYDYIKEESCFYIIETLHGPDLRKFFRFN